MSASADRAVNVLNQLLQSNLRLEKILEKGGAKDGKGEGKDEGVKGKEKISSDDVAKLTDISKVLAETITAINKSGKIDPNKGKQIAKFLNNFAEGIKDVVKDIDEKKLDSFTKILEVIIEGSGKFIKEMAFLTIIMPLAMLGAAGFSFILVIMTKILDYAATLDEDTTKGLEAVMKIGKGAFLFGLSLAVFLIISPFAAMGALAFVTILTGLSVALRIATYITGTNEEGPLYKLKDIAIGLAVFSLVLVAYALAGPILAQGALNFVLILGGIALGVGIATKLAGSTPDGGSALEGLLKLGWSLAIFGLTLALFAILSPLIAIGAITFILVILGISWALKKSAKMLEGNDENSPIYKLGEIGKGIIIFGLALALTGLLSPLIAIGAIVMTLSIMGIGWALGKFMSSEKVAAGVENLKKLSIAMVIFSAAILVLSFVKDWMNVGIGILAIGAFLVVIGGAAWLLGKMDKKGQVTQGFALMAQLNESLLLIAGAGGIIAVLSLINDWGNVFIGIGAVALAITVLGLAAYVIGQVAVAPFVGIGAGLLVVLGAGLFAFAESLKILSEIKITEKSAKSLGDLIVQVGLGVASLGVNPGVFLGSLLLIPLAIGIFTLSFGLKMFQKIGYTKKTGDLLKDAVSKVVEVFTESFKNLTFTDWLQINAGIQMVGKMGSAIASLAEGVAKMANLEIVEYDVKDGKIIPKVSRKLTKDDFTAAGENVKAILTVLIEPLRWFGYNVSAGEGFFFGDGYIEKGIGMLSKLSKGVATLAEGVGKMANLEVTSYEVKDGKLVPKETRKLNKDDFTAAGNNVKQILHALITPLRWFGYQATKGEGNLWGDGYIAKGLSALTDLSGSLKDLAEGVASMANLEVTTYKVKDGKLVPDETRKLKESDFIRAGNNVRQIIGALLKPLKWFGYEATKGEGDLWGDGYIAKGIEALGSVTEPIGDIADMVVKLGTGQFEVKKVVKDPKTGVPKLVTDKLISPGEAVTKAKAVLDRILWIIPHKIKDLAAWWVKNDMAKQSEIALAGLGVMGEFMEGFVDLTGSYTNALENYNKTKEFKVTGNQMIYGIKELAYGILSLSHIHPSEETTDKLTTLLGSVEVIEEIMGVYLSIRQSTDEFLKIALKTEPLDLLINASKKIDILSTSFNDEATIKLLTLLDSMEVIEDIMDVYLDIREVTNEILKISLKTEPLDLLINAAAKLKTLGTSFSSDAKSGIILFQNSMLYVKNSLFTYIGMAKALQKAKINTTRPEDVLIRLSKALIHLGTTFNKKMRKAEINNFKLFNDQVKRLAMMASPFEKFERSFGRMAKHMGIFATNFKVMSPTAINAFKDWTDSMVTISKVDISKSNAIVDFVNKTVDAAWGAGDAGPDTKTPQQYTATEKKANTDSAPNKLGGGGKGKGGKEQQQPQQHAKVDTTAITNAITAALRNLTVQSITVKGNIIDEK